MEEAKKRNVYDENANFLNEKPIDSFLYSIAMSYGATNPRDRYIDFVKELTEQENCIIIGRCADYVLKDDPNVLRLFFFAPKEDCIVRVMEHDGITRRDAENKIEKIDKHRADYYKYYTGKDWYDARNYDFCLDTTSMGYEKLVEVVKNFIEVYQS